MNAKNSRLVYSTEHGRDCPACKKPLQRCNCNQKPVRPKGDGIVRVGRSTKGRKGKGVTIIAGLPLDRDDMKRVAKSLKIKCGTGGTVKNGTIEIQGDHRDLLMAELAAMGYSVKRSGG